MEETTTISVKDLIYIPDNKPLSNDSVINGSNQKSKKTLNEIIQIYKHLQQAGLKGAVIDRNNFPELKGINMLMAALLKNNLVKIIGRQSYKNLYTWNTISPTIYMAEKIYDEIRVEKNLRKKGLFKKTRRVLLTTETIQEILNFIYDKAQDFAKIDREELFKIYGTNLTDNVLSILISKKFLIKKHITPGKYNIIYKWNTKKPEIQMAIRIRDEIQDLRNRYKRNLNKKKTIKPEITPKINHPQKKRIRVLWGLIDITY